MVSESPKARSQVGRDGCVHRQRRPVPPRSRLEPGQGLTADCHPVDRILAQIPEAREHLDAWECAVWNEIMTRADAKGVECLADVLDFVAEWPESAATGIKQR